MPGLVLSLFPGIGLLDMAFEADGFTVVRGPDCLWGGDIRAFHPPAGKFDGIIGGPPCQMFSSLAHLLKASGRKTRFGNMIPEYERCVDEAQPAWFLMENVRAAPAPASAGYGVTEFFLDNAMVLGDDGFGQEQTRLRKFNFGCRGKDAPNLLRWIDLAVFMLPDADGTQWSPDNSKDAKRKVRHEAVTGGHDRPPSKRIGNGKAQYKEMLASLEKNGMKIPERLRTGTDRVYARRYKLSDACRLQGLPEDFLKDAPFTAEGKLKAVANGVPLPMGRAIARAIIEATRLDIHG